MTFSGRVNLVRHISECDVEVLEENVTYEDALLSIEVSSEDLDMISVETGRFVSWVLK